MTRLSQIHELKTWPEYFAAIRIGLKRFEVRPADRDFAVGDVLILREYEPHSDTYSGHYLTAAVTYVLGFPVFTHPSVPLVPHPDAETIGPVLVPAPMTRCVVLGIGLGGDVLP